MFWERSETQFRQPKKVDKLSKFLENPASAPPPPLDKILVFPVWDKIKKNLFKPGIV